MRGYFLLFGLVASGLVFGCRQAPSTERVAELPHDPPQAVVRAEAGRLMERGEYRKAAEKYQEAVALEPDDMALRYSLGTAYSHLGRRGEAAEQFQWAVKQGDPAADYYRGALQWLVRAGLVSDGRASLATPNPAGDHQAQQPTKGKIGGSLEWPGVNSRERLIKVRVTLSGDDPGTKPVNLSRPFRLGERYEFRDLEPGRYRLVARAEDGAPAVELWNQQVTVVAGQVTQLSLGPTNSKVSPDQFPGPAPR